MIEGQFPFFRIEVHNFLAGSAANYYGPDEVRDLFLKAGFSSVRYRELFFGAAGIHTAIK